MRAVRLAPLAVAALVGGGCQEEAGPPVPPSCTAEPAAIVQALTAAPGAVTLPGGVALSACVRDADSDADLQNVGVAFSRAAENLELPGMRGDERAALQLGYLVGATRKGAATTSGIGAELVRRLERSAAAVDEAPSRRAASALRRGLAAGEARG
jgi:hypothetical protein